MSSSQQAWQWRSAHWRLKALSDAARNYEWGRDAEGVEEVGCGG